MAYQTLYRKYRPNSFEFVYGQDVIVKTLKNIIKSNKLSHAYLFTGPRGTGKTSCAKLFAKSINCLNPKDGDACNECETCKSFNENSNPDIIEMDAASNNGVDEIREIKNKVNLVPAISKYKVYIIDEVHMLSIGAFNALLKTLEEPPEYVIFILATTDPQKIPPTIISRCQRFDFKSISPEKMKKCLENIAQKENIKIENDALESIVKVSNGGMRDAIGLLDQSSVFNDKKIEKKDINELSGNVLEEEIEEFLTVIKQQKYQEIINKIRSWYEQGKDFNLICQMVINYIRDGIVYKKSNSKEYSEQHSQFYKMCSDTELYFIFDYFIELQSKIQISVQKELTFEVYIIRLVDKLNTNVLHEKSAEISQANLKDDVSRETSKQNLSTVFGSGAPNVSAEIKKSDEKAEKLRKCIENIKNVRINNIILESTKKEMENIKQNWNKINDFLFDFKFGQVAGILLEGNPVAASDSGIIITYPTSTFLNKIENKYEESIEIFKKILNKKYKIVYITNDYWLQIRPEYIEKVKNKSLKYENEEKILNKIKQIKSNSSIKDFDEFVEMEAK